MDEKNRHAALPRRSVGEVVVRTIYHVEVESQLEAEALCRRGDVAYEHSSIEEGGEEWLETVSMELAGRR